MNKKGKLTILSFVFVLLIFALIYYTLFVIPNTGGKNSSGGTSFWGRYGYNFTNTNYSSFGDESTDSKNITSTMTYLQCSLLSIGDDADAEAAGCPKKTPWDLLSNFGGSMLLGAYQAFVSLFALFGSFKVVITTSLIMIGIPQVIADLLIMGISFAIFVSIIVFIFNRSFEQ